MNATTIIIEGIGATLLMSFFVRYFLLGLKPNVIVILGSMLLSVFSKQLNPNRAITYIIGAIVHYAIGILFSFSVNLLWDIDIILASFLACCIEGLFLGLIAIVGWGLFFAFHPKPPQVNLKLYLVKIFAGPIVFGIGMFLMRALIIPSDYISNVIT